MSQDQPPVFRLDPMGGLLGSGRRPVPPPPRVRFEDVPPPPVRSVPRPVEPAPAKPAAPVAPPREPPQLRVVAPGAAEVAAKALADLTRRGVQIVEAPAPAPAPAAAPPPPPAPTPAAPPVRVAVPRSAMGEHYAARLAPDGHRGKILHALGTLSTQEPVSVGDLVVRCWELYPEAFALQGYPQHPNSNAVLSKLFGTEGLDAGGWVRRPVLSQYALTAEGRRWCKHVWGLR